jgi:hypothetical protein
MKAIKIEILRKISDDFPGFVECRFFDASGKEHRFQEKIPVVTETYNENGDEPQYGMITCEVNKEWKDANNRIVCNVSTEKPWGIETTEGLDEFDIFTDQLIDILEKS